MNNFHQILTIFLFLFTIQISYAWKLVWEDNFDGDKLDLTKWSYDYGDNWFHNELQAYTNLTRNVFLKDGYLYLQAVKENYHNKNYTSGRVFTKYTASFMYGRFEAKMKMASGQGMWPAFWLLPVWLDWPKYGEIDIMEYLGHEPYTQYGTAHYANDYFHLNSKGGIYKAPHMLNETFNVFAVEWEPEEIRFFVNEVNFFTFNKNMRKQGELWPFENIPYYIILNLAVGGNWPKPPDNTTVFPNQFIIDYVRFFKKILYLF